MFATAPVLGIDPGLSRCGYGAVVRESGARLRAVSCGVLRTDPELDLPQRLSILHDELESLIVEVRPSVVVVERLLFQNNVRTAISVGQASGLALTIAARHHIEVVQYSPNEVKLAVAGDGSAGKPEVGAMVARLLKLREVPQPADAADALALALCHLWRARVGAAPVSKRTLGVRSDREPGSLTGLDQRIAAAQARRT